MFKTILKALGVLAVIGIAVLIYNYKTIQRLQRTIHLFDEDVIVYNFQHMDELGAVTRLKPSPSPVFFPKALNYKLIEQFKFKDSTFTTEAYLKNTRTEGLMILHRDTIVFEEYYNGLTEQTTHISWSMAKSVVSTLLGIAHDDGLFELDAPITQYLPQFKGTGYDGVPIKHILQMSSGVGFNEDYGDYNSDINRFGRAFAVGSSFEEFAKTLKKDKPSGTYCHYVSIDTQVLGILLAKITGKSLTEYLKEKIWIPMGMQDNAEWIIDDSGFEMALGGLNMTLRDYAKLGQLFLHKGQFNGQQIVSAEWVEAATTPDAPHLMPGNHGQSSHNLGYGYQWWIPEVDEGDFFAAGIYNQYIYVQAKKDLVIVKLTANHHFKTEGPITKDIHIAMFKEIAETFPEQEVETLRREEEE